MNVAFSEDQVAERVKALADEINRDYAGGDLLLVGILGGCVQLLPDIMRALTIPYGLSFISVTSYGAGSGDIRVALDTSEPVRGRDVVFVDGAIISGATHRYLVDWMVARGARSTAVCAAVAKLAVPADLPLKYIGFRSDRYIAGYGIGHKGQYRGTPCLVDVSG